MCVGIHGVADGDEVELVMELSGESERERERERERENLADTQPDSGAHTVVSRGPAAGDTVGVRPQRRHSRQRR